MAKSFVTKAASAPDPAPVFKFWVEVDGIVEAEFKECSGLRLERAVEEIPAGGVNDHVHILPGSNRYGSIVLKDGRIYSNALWNWYQAGLRDGKVERKELSILIRGVGGQVVNTWSFGGAYPARWDGPALNVETNQAAVETIEFATGTGGGAGGGGGGAERETRDTAEAQRVDTPALAERVYRLLKDEARVERERLGRSEARGAG